MKSRKQLEALAKAKKEQEERQKKRDEELRIENERRRKEQKEREEQERRIQEERRLRELQLTELHRTKSGQLLSRCVAFLTQSAVAHWQLKLFHWCMRTDGLPDPCDLRQLNAYHYRWLETSASTEPSMERLLSRAPELNQVIHDLDELLENTHDIGAKQVDQLCQARMELSKLLKREIDAAIQCVLKDVSHHLAIDETQLNVQTSSKSFLLALGTDTAKNSSHTTHDFTRLLGFKIELPLSVLASEKSVVISIVWLREGHHLDGGPWVNGVPSLPSLINPLANDDILYQYTTDSLRVGQQQQQQRPSPIPTAAAVDDADDDSLDSEFFLIVAGVFQVQLLQLPVQPRRFANCTVALNEDGGEIKVHPFQSTFSGQQAITAAAAEKEAKNKKAGGDDDDDAKNAKEMNEELKKLISVRIKLPTTSFWLGCPRPVIYQKDSGKWKSEGVWDVRYHEEIGGPSVQFRLENPSIVALAQARKLNLPLQGWTLFPSHMRSAFMNSMQSKPLAEATKGGLGGGAGGGEWEAGMSDDEDSNDEEGGGGGKGQKEQQQQQQAVSQVVVEEDEPEEIVYDPDARSVTLTLTGAMVSLDIEIQENQVLLRRVRATTTFNVQDITGKAMTPFELIKVLRKRGLDLAPPVKLCSSMDILPKKNPATERHLYRCISALAASEKFSFLHSRWNLMSGEDNFILQYQIMNDDTSLGSACLAQISSERARLLPINENSLSLEQGSDITSHQDCGSGAYNSNSSSSSSSKELVDSQFYGDIYNALSEACPATIRDHVLNPSPAFVETIYTMLACTKPISTG